jgi:hypothetical protein
MSRDALKKKKSEWHVDGGDKLNLSLEETKSYLSQTSAEKIQT